MEKDAQPAREYIGAALMAAIGIAVAVMGFGYEFGSLTRMGAGFVPVALGILFVLTGALIAATAHRAEREIVSIETSSPMPLRSQWRGWVCILGCVGCFVVLGHWGGLVPATFACVFISALGDRGNSVRDAFLLALALTVAGTLIFHYALNVAFPLFTWG